MDWIVTPASQDWKMFIHELGQSAVVADGKTMTKLIVEGVAVNNETL